MTDKPIALFAQAEHNCQCWIDGSICKGEHVALQVDNQLQPLSPQGQTEPEQFVITRLWQASRK